MTNHDLLRKLNDQPFRPFRIKLTNSTTIDLLEPGTCIVGDISAVLPVETVTDGEGFRIVKSWKTISLDHIVEFSDLNLKDRGGRQKR